MIDTSRGQLRARRARPSYVRSIGNAIVFGVCVCGAPSCDEDWAYRHRPASGGTNGAGGVGAGADSGGSSNPGAGGRATTSSGGNRPNAAHGGAASAVAGQGGSADSGGGGLDPGNTGGVGPATGGTAGEAGAAPMFNHYGATDTGFRYSGRIDFSNPASPRFGEGAIHVSARFKGTALRVLLKDEFRYGTYRDYFEVVIDGERHKIAPVRGTTAYEVTRSLGNGEHSVVVSKRTEASIGTAQFLGMDIVGELLGAPAVEPHRIEVIGDSISAGSGNEAANGSAECNEDGWGQPYQNGDLAYGPVLARKLNADYHVTAVSGIGLVRNYSNMYDARPMPAVYDLLYVDSMASPKWDTTRFLPDAIVVMLGTNDFSPGDNPPSDPRTPMDRTTYLNAYVAFVDMLHGYYPAAHVFGVSSPMLGDGWPNSTDTFASDLKSVLTEVEAHYAAANEPLFHKVFVTKVTGTGCGTHPGVAQHQAMAAEIEPVIRSVMGW